MARSFTNNAFVCIYTLLLAASPISLEVSAYRPRVSPIDHSTLPRYPLFVDISGFEITIHFANRLRKAQTI